jgi:hypothetical protein
LFVFSGGGAKVQERRFLGKLLEQTTLSVAWIERLLQKGRSVEIVGFSIFVLIYYQLLRLMGGCCGTLKNQLFWFSLWGQIWSSTDDELHDSNNMKI